LYISQRERERDKIYITGRGFAEFYKAFDVCRFLFNDHDNVNAGFTRSQWKQRQVVIIHPPVQ